MKLDTLQKRFLNELRHLYHAENQLLKALPKMARAASSSQLKKAFQTHLDQTEDHVCRLELIFVLLDEPPKGKVCHAMKGLIDEASALMKEAGEESVLDAGIIVAAQKVEHYEIASYASLRTFAELLGHDEAVELLQSSLDEESQTNELLNNLAEHIVNPEALLETELASTARLIKRNPTLAPTDPTALCIHAAMIRQQLPAALPLLAWQKPQRHSCHHYG